jgi:hypothetical protein
MLRSEGLWAQTDKGVHCIRLGIHELIGFQRQQAIITVQALPGLRAPHGLAAQMG